MLTFSAESFCVRGELAGWRSPRNPRDYILPIGPSMGGVTALKLAAEFPAAGVTSMGTSMRGDRSLRS